uniref:Uncharacterized protein n=1 Tax=viral metagenome TaxID=1070528 RepID=A0A6H1ZG78_9ZZZZ
MKKKYTIGEIREKWSEYKLALGYRVLVDGRWAIVKKLDTSGATRAEMIKVKDHVSFPEYLEK